MVYVRPLCPILLVFLTLFAQTAFHWQINGWCYCIKVLTTLVSYLFAYPSCQPENQTSIQSGVGLHPNKKKKNLLHPSANQTSCSFLERQQARCCCFQIQKQNKVTNRKSTTKNPTGTVSDPTQFRSDASHSQYQGFASLRDHIDKGMWAGSFV